MSIAPATSRIEYPSSDGQPMGETWIHVRSIMWLHQALEDLFHDRSDTPIDDVDPDTLESRLGFRLRTEGTMLRLIDGRTGKPILTRAEQVQQANARLDQAQAAADAEKRRADALAEVERLNKLLGGTGP